MYDIEALNKKLLPELRELGKELKIKRVESYKKQELIYKILDAQAIHNAVQNEKNEDIKSKQIILKRDKTPKLSKVDPADLNPDSAQKKSRRRIDPSIASKGVMLNSKSDNATDSNEPSTSASGQSRSRRISYGLLFRNTQRKNQMQIFLWNQ